MRPEMHVKRPRFFVQHVIVNSGDFDSIGAQRGCQLDDFATQRRDIARDRSFAVAPLAEN